MKHWTLYRLLLRFLPQNGEIVSSTFSEDQTNRLEGILLRYRCLGACLCAFDEKQITGSLAFGAARSGVPVSENTFFRAASVSKFATGLALMKLKEQGLDIDEDVHDFLPFSLRHPKAPGTSITLRMLMTHTAGICDSSAYNTGIAKGKALSAFLGESFAEHLPGVQWEYSNLGAGIAGLVAEGATGMDFETFMQRTLFSPLNVEATFYPQKLPAHRVLADARRILPPHKGPNFDAEKRRGLPLPEAAVDFQHHYNLAHGNLCITAQHLARIGIAAMTPGYLSEASLQEMRTAAIPFGKRAKNLSQGLFTFILQDKRVSPHVIYGHQGMAYGAVHGLFFDPESKKGVALLTSGASEARRGVMADLNMAILRELVGEKHGSRH